MIQDRRWGWLPTAGYECMQELLRRTETHAALPDVVVPFDDCAAYGAIRAIAEAGMVCPDDIAVVEFDDIVLSQFYNPPLTTVYASLGQMADASVAFVVGSWRAENPDIVGRCVMMPAEVVVRRSCGAGRESR